MTTLTMLVNQILIEDVNRKYSQPLLSLIVPNTVRVSSMVPLVCVILNFIWKT